MSAIGTRKLTLTIDGTDVTPEVSLAEITSAEAKSDFVSFAAAASGGSREYSLKLTFVQNAATASLWSQVWESAGNDIPVIVRPAGNAVPTPEDPHFTGTVTISEPNGTLLGGAADASTSNRFVTEVEWVFTGKPSRVTA